MTPERHARIVELFHAAAERPPAARAAFVLDACEGDSELQRQVHEMLIADSDANLFFDDPPDDIAAEAAVSRNTGSLIGRTLGHYRIMAWLGSGGMGDVFLAHDTQLNRKTALKLLPEAFASDSDRLSRFEREALAVSPLNHPNIVTVYGVGQVGGLHVLAAEYVEGHTLRDLIRKGPVSPGETVRIGKQIALALEVAHSHGVIHRDIKPENIMQRPDGLIKLLDFGLAKWARTDGVETRTRLGNVESALGLILGTPRYMSPEQARGLAIDHRTDLFSLGAVLYEMLAGFPAMPGITPSDIIASILTRDPDPLERSRPECPRSIVRVIHRALQKDREKRYSTASELAVDLGLIDSELAAGDTRRFKIVGSPRSIGVACAVAVLLLSFLLFYFSGRASPIDSIAVLPLENKVGLDSQYVADGLTDSLARDLAEIPQLRLASRTSASRARAQNPDPALAGKLLKVRTVLHGGVSQRNDRLIVHLELIDVTKGRSIWEKSYSPTWADLPDAQSTISHEVIAVLGIKPNKQAQDEMDKRHDVRPAAYRLYLKGHSAVFGPTQSDLEEAVQYGHRVLEIDPTFGPAAVDLSYAYVALADYISPQSAMPKAREYALKAIQVGGSTADAHVALGLVKLLYDWDWRGAEQEFTWDSASNPRGVNAFSCYLHYQGAVTRAGGATAAIRHLLSLDPLSTWANHEMSCAFYYARQYRPAVEQFSKTVKMSADFQPAYVVGGRALVQQGKFQEAIAVLEEGRKLDPAWPLLLTELAYAHAASGNRDVARQTLNELELIGQRRYVDPFLISLVYLRLGDRDEAFSYLEKAYAMRSSSMPWLKAEPRFDPIRSDSRYLEMLRRVGLPD